MKHLTVKEKEKEAFSKMKEAFHYKNGMAAPKMLKVVMNIGTCTMMKKDKNKNDDDGEEGGRRRRKQLESYTMTHLTSCL
mgnify:CR=1 FL=1